VVQIRRGDSADDVNQLVGVNAAIFEPEYGIDASFASDMAVQLAELRRSGWPAAGEGLWLAELDGRVVGGVTLRKLGGGLGQLGHLALLAEARGSGAGRRLVTAVLDAARGGGYERLQLFTFSELRAAAALYRSVGFEVMSTEDVVRWGRRMQWQRYELAL
jgi:ribosomal protein S18 acetylase RimI-like enzyme